MSESQELKKLNLYQRLLKIEEKVNYIKKSVSIEMRGSVYKAVSHDDVARICSQAMIEYGVKSMASVVDCEYERYDVESKHGKNLRYESKLNIEVVYINIDNPVERHVVRSCSNAIDSMDKATGKAYSMALKYAHLKAFNIETGEIEEADNILRKYVSNDLLDLRTELISLLKKNGIYESGHEIVISKMNHNELKEKIAKYKTGGE